jgi:polyhydroxybutyrate depolymerase
VRPVVLVLLAACVAELPDVEAPCEAWDEPGLYQFKVTTKEGPKRRAFVWVPTGEGPRNMVVALHGAASTPTDFSDVSQHMRVAENEGFVAVFPQGRGSLANSWNAGDCCGSAQADRRDVDDVAYLEQLVRELSPKVCGAKVLGTGFSNGGMLAHRWACEGEQVDAIVPASGPLQISPSKCKGPPVPVRHYHGLADDIVPYEGGVGSNFSGVDHQSVDATMKAWRERNDCSDAEPAVFTNGDTTCTRWACQAPTELCTVTGWTHAWPGGRNADRTSADATRDGYAWFDALWSEDQP